MKRMLRARGASAAVAGVAILLVAGGGLALAGGGRTIKACVHKGSHALYTGRCRKGDKKLTWNTAGPRGPAGATGATGPQGSAGSPGAPGTARAYAHVEVSGGSPTFDAARTRGFIAVSRPSTGQYCLTPAPGVDESSYPAVADPEWSGSNGASFPSEASVSDIVLGGCSPGDFTVKTYTGSTLVNNVAFNIIVP